MPRRLSRSSPRKKPVAVDSGVKHLRSLDDLIDVSFDDITSMQPAIRRATEADLPAVERLVNGAYVVEEFFLDGGRIDLDELVTTARSGGEFIVLEEPVPMR